MKSFLSSVLLVGLFGFVLGGVYRSPDAYVVQPAITTQHHLIATGTNVHYSPISAADGSGGYGAPAPAPVALSGGYNAPAPAPAPNSGGYSYNAPAPAPNSGGYNAPAPAPAAPSGGYSSGGAIDSFADPRNRGPEPPAPKPVYGLPAMLALASSSDGAASSGSSSGSDSFGGSDFNTQELDAAIKSQDIVSVEATTAKSTSTTIPADEEDFPDIDFTPPRKSFLSRAWTFITKQFTAILGFLRRIWARVQAFRATSA